MGSRDVQAVDTIVTTVGELMDAVAPAFREILTTAELAGTTTVVLRQPGPFSWRPLETWPVVADGDTLDDDCVLWVRTLGDSALLWVGSDGATAQETYERVRSELQDFVAESSFGWGQLRP